MPNDLCANPSTINHTDILLSSPSHTNNTLTPSIFRLRTSDHLINHASHGVESALPRKARGVHSPDLYHLSKEQAMPPNGFHQTTLNRSSLFTFRITASKAKKDQTPLVSKDKRCYNRFLVSRRLEICLCAVWRHNVSRTKDRG